jgi:hypothetical protein
MDMGMRKYLRNINSSTKPKATNISRIAIQSPYDPKEGLSLQCLFLLGCIVEEIHHIMMSRSHINANFDRNDRIEMPRSIVYSRK